MLTAIGSTGSDNFLMPQEAPPVDGKFLLLRLSGRLFSQHAPAWSENSPSLMSQSIPPRRWGGHVHAPVVVRRTMSNC